MGFLVKRAWGKLKPRAERQVVKALDNQALQVAHVQALTQLAEAVNSVAVFLTQGGLGQTLSSYARLQAVGEILSGLAAHDGRNALDARFMKQNAIEIAKHIEAAVDKYAEDLKAKGKVDPDIHDAERELLEHEAKMKELNGR